MEKYTFKIENQKYEVEIDVNQNIADVLVNGKSYKVEIERTENNNTENSTTTPRTSIRSPKVPDTSLSTDSDVTKIKSPLPGNVLQVLVNKGEHVKRGDVLIIIEAMKMENNIMAGNDGIIRNVLTQPGKTVMLGDPLIEIEEIKILN